MQIASQGNQDDFASLLPEDWKLASSMDETLDHSTFAEKILLKAGDSNGCDDDCTNGQVDGSDAEPVDELMFLITNWGTVTKTKSPDDSLNIIDETISEPVRSLPNLEIVPPKRFYRTFWCGLTRRLIRCHHQKFILRTNHADEGSSPVEWDECSSTQDVVL